MGQSMALAFAEEGANVAISGRREKALEETASLWQGHPPIVHHPADVTVREDVKRLFGWFDKRLGPVHILINNAGINIPDRAMKNLTHEGWDKILAVNATGAFNCMHAVLPQMRERKDGLIINISSIAGIRANLIGGVAYSAAKFAMSALGMTVNLEENQNGIRVTNIYPGGINTSILDDRPVPVPEEQRGLMLQPEDIVAAVIMVTKLPPRANVPELTIKPTNQEFA